jgi:hypothetical protein
MKDEVVAGVDLRNASLATTFIIFVLKLAAQ